MPYADVNGLDLYHEQHGEGFPLVLIHGGLTTIELSFGEVLPAFAEHRRVIAVELQGHGRTADVDRPLTYEGMADDAAALLGHLGVAQADVVGYSMGGCAAIQIAIRHPQLVRALVTMSAGFRSDAMQPELLAMIPTITPEMFVGSPFEDTYKAVAPHPDRFPELVTKLKQLDETPFAWPEADISGIAAPTLIVTGDADASVIEHSVAMFRLLDGGRMGDVHGIGRARLAVLPGTAHFMPPGIGMLDRAEWLLALIPAFLDAPDGVPAPTF